MRIINIIGNNAKNRKLSDGGRIKIRLYKELLEREGYAVNIIELDGWKKRIFRIYLSIRTAISNGEDIIIMAGPMGCRYIIPIVNALNRKKKSRVVFCPLGIGTLDYVVKKLDADAIQSFLGCELEIKNEDQKMAKMLSRMDYVVLQNDALLKRYKSYYFLSNAEVLANFRDVLCEPKEYSCNSQLKIIYLSRIRRDKGIFDLIQAVRELHDSNMEIKLDIYGDNQLNENDKNEFGSSLCDFIEYKGVVDSLKSIETIRHYDLFCLPTKYYGEGTSGALVESMLAGVPPLVSNYNQAKNLVEDGKTGFIFDFDSVDSLKRKITMIYNNRHLLKKNGEGAQKIAERYTYNFNRKKFLELLAGEK